MSMFLPETQAAPQSGTSLAPADVQTSQEDMALMQRLFAAAAANPLAVPSGFWQYALEYVQVNRLTIPIGQVFGYGQNVRTTALVIANSQSVPSGVDTPAVFASATYDPSAMWNGVSTLLVPTTGVYEVTWNGQIASTLSYKASLDVVFAAGGHLAGAGSGFVDTPFLGGMASGSTLVPLTKGDGFNLNIAQNSGVNQTVIGLRFALALVTPL